MEILFAFPVLSLLVVFQSAFMGRIFLLHGSADLVLLVILAWALQERVSTAWHWAVIGGLLDCIPSAQPFFSPLIGYVLATGVALFWIIDQPGCELGSPGLDRPSSAFA